MKKQTVFLLSVSAAALLILTGYKTMDYIKTDRTPPEIRFDTDVLSVSVNDAEEVCMQGVSAIDDTDGDVTQNMVIESIYGMNENGETTVTYAAFDRAGNVSKRTRTVAYTDYHAPRFSLDAPLIYEYGTSFDILSDLYAQDVRDGDLTSSIKATMTSSGSSVSEEGVHDVLFRVTNSLGDTAQLSLPVEVYPVDTYSAELTLDTYLVYIAQGTPFDAADYPDSLYVRDRIIDLSSGSASGVTLRTDSNVDTDIPGLYSVQYTVGYTLNGNTFTGYTRLFVVVEKDSADTVSE